MNRAARAAALAVVVMRAVCLAVLVSGVFAALAPRTARADDPEMQASVDTQRLGVGDVLRLSLHVASRQHQPSNAHPGSTPGFTVLGSSSGPSQQVTITNGRMVSQRGLDVNWTLRADKVGVWSVGPVTVQVGGTTYRAGPIRITVVQASQAPPRAAPDPFDPFGGGGAFDPFRGLIDQLSGQPSRGDSFGADPKLALDQPLGTVAFLHATVDTTNVVVGQQVTVSMYLYVDANVRDPGMVDVHEATAADFVKRPLFEDDNSDHGVTRAMAGGHLFNVRLLRKWALFPIKTGDLTMSPMELTLQRTRSTGDPSRKSEDITIHVTEPPADHRPPGYQQGDVGAFRLAAEVTPRDIEEDGAVGVTLSLDGTGNLPAMITPPAQAGLEWLVPEVHEKVGPLKGDRFGGTRTFSYVVRVHKTGDVKLGSIALPYWDPALKKYDTARAELGVVTVRPGAVAKPAVEAPPDPFAMLPEVRGAMGGTHAPRSQLAESRTVLFWLAFGVTPVGFFAFSGAAAAVRRLRERAKERAESPETELRTKLALAEAAAKASDARALSATTARALEAATVAYADVNVRDARGSEASARLIEAGVEDAIARKVEAVLTACGEARFSPDEPDLGEARARFKAAKDAIGALRKAA